ncbi:MAG: nicotinamide riboside transporter PnuC [Lactobacillaceae bacterium]|jgi:nicotinamide mononucleotide transporter|nr:nicotinamide riboside transporter PnuC [Lactobacillaceae bacterium]
MSESITAHAIWGNLKMLLSPSWYRKQFSGWMPASWVLYVIGFILITVTTFFYQAATNKFGVFNPGQIGWITYFGAIIGLLTTFAITNAKPVNGLLGLISAVLLIIASFEAKNPGESALQFVYIILLDLPVLILPGWANDVEKKVRRIAETSKRGEKHAPSFWYTVFAITFLASWAILYVVESNQWIPSGRPALDSFSAAVGITASLMATLRFSDQYYLWTTTGVLQLLLWAVTFFQGGSSPVLALTYLLYLSNDVLGFVQSSWFHHEDVNKELASK